jgi:acetolactate synthase regulatory subunit
MSASVRSATFFLVFSAALMVVACEKDHSVVASSARLDRGQYSPTIAADSAVAADFATIGTAFGRRAGVGGAVRSAPSRNAPAAERTPAPANQTGAQTVAQEVVPGSMLVRVGQASVQVDSLDVGIARIREVARRTNAVIANTSMEGGRDQTRAASLELRIPSERFDEAVTGLTPIGKVESVNVTVQDVGEEFVDAQARVANAHRLEQRLVELLANRTGKLSDVLTVERELARVREEIERYEGRLRYLRSRASVSTLSIAIHEPFPIVAERPGTHPMRDAFIQAWRNLISVTAAMIASLGVVIPLAILVGVFILIGRRVLPGRAFRLAPKPAGTESA